MRSTYWQATSISPQALFNKPKNGGILIIGAGIAGVSVAYWLKQSGMDCQIVDCGGENASYYRNAGHMLHGTGESYEAMVAIHGEEKADLIQDVALGFLLDAEDTIIEEGIDCDFNKNGYYRIPLDSTETEELKASVEKGKWQTRWKKDINLNLSTVATEAFFCHRSRSGHPVKFRNGVLKSSGVSVYSHKVVDVRESGGRASVRYADGSCSAHDAVVIAANAYSPLLHKWTKIDS
jgi:glycine/D-amino acid oxidase-like deaminating enzyme